MRIIIWSDLQLHTWRKFGYDPETRIPVRLSDQISVMDQVTEIANSEKVDLGIFGGDWFEVRGSILVECLYFTKCWMKQQKIEWLR